MEHHGPTSWLLSLPLLPHDESLIHINAAVVVFLLLSVLSIVAYFALKNRIDSFVVPPKRFGLVAFVDLLVESLYGMIVATLGPHGKQHFPFIASLFIFVLASNLLGLLPMSSAPTSNVNTTIALGAFSFLYYNIMGIREHGLVGYLKHFLMGLGPFGILIALLEVISHAIRPISLGLRLFVNMHVDHAVVMSFTDLFAWLLPVPLLLFGVMVCTIQAFVFATLSAVYVQMATEHDH